MNAVVVLGFIYNKPILVGSAIKIIEYLGCSFNAYTILIQNTIISLINFINERRAASQIGVPKKVRYHQFLYKQYACIFNETFRRDNFCGMSCKFK